MEPRCLHTNRASVGDMPIADPETFDFLGRFDVVQCVDCEEVLSKTPTKDSELAKLEFGTITQP